MRAFDTLKAAAGHLPEPVLQRAHSASLGARLRTGNLVSPEPEFALLDKLVPVNEHVIDGGANFGIFSMAIAPLLDTGNWVFAFEPVAATYRILTRQIERSGFTNIALFPTALSNADGFVGFEAPRWEDGRENLYQSSVTASAPPSAIAMRGDFVDGLGSVGFIKLDVEGHELAALQGLQRVLASSAPNLLVEGDDPAVAELLVSQGYDFVQLDGSPNRVFVSKQRDADLSLLAEIATTS